MSLHSRLLAEDPLSQVTDIREYDVPYLARVRIDLNIRIGCWYDVSSDRGVISVTRQEHILTPSNAKVFAFDIECAKAPLKFADASVDAISYEDDIPRGGSVALLFGLVSSLSLRRR